MKIEVADLEVEKEELSTELAETKKAIYTLQNDIAHAERDLEQQKADLAIYQTALSGCEEGLNDSNKNLIRLKKIIGDYENSQKAVEMWDAANERNERELRRKGLLEQERKAILNELREFNGLGCKVTALAVEIAKLDAEIAGLEA